MNHLSTATHAAAAILIATAAPTAGGNVFINEIMQSNIDCLFVDNEYPDSWVELYNNASENVSLEGWTISPTSSRADGYQLPAAAAIGPEGFLLIYCDKSDTGGLHTTFRLESSKGGSFYLFDADGHQIDALTSIKKMPAPNVAYGRLSDGSSSWRYMTTATPGRSNINTEATQASNTAVHPSPLFSRDSFVSVEGSDRFSLTVSKPADATADALLCVTTDGREPTTNDAVNADSWTIDIDFSTVVRAKLLGGSLLPVRSTTHSYLYLPEATNLRVVSLVGDPDDFYDSSRGILAGAPFSYEMTNHDIASSNWNQDWRRPVNVEYFTASDHRPTINQLAETRVQGGVTRCYDQKSLALYANKRFGTKRFDTSDFWPDKTTVTSSKSFLIRNGGNMFLTTRVNDALAQTLIAADNSNLDWQAYSPSIYFLNGKYMGLGDLRERSNEDNIAANYTDAANAELEDIDMIENWTELKAGTTDAFDDFCRYYNSSDVTLDGLRSQMDVNNFVDQLVIHWFGGNNDFFLNNIVMWRPTATDGRWRWLLKDVDLFANTLNTDLSQRGDYYETAEAAYAKSPQLLRLFRLFYEELPQARDLFVDRMLVCLGDMLQPSSIKTLDQSLVDQIIDEYPRHLRRYFTEERATRLMDEEYIGAFPGGNTYIANDWAVSRSVRVYAQFQSRYNLGDRVYMKIYRGDDNPAPVSLQGFPLTRTKFDGQWFTGREIRLSTDDSHTIQLYVNGSFIGDYGHQITITPTGGSIDFRIVKSTSNSAIDTIPADDLPATYFTPSGLRVTNPTPGQLYIVRRAGHTSRSIYR